MSTRVPLLSAQEGDAGGTGHPPAGGTTAPSLPVSEVQANTGGGLLYRMLWYGRRDKRKELTPGVKTKKAAAFEGLDFDDFLSPIVEAHRKATKHADHLRVAAMRWVLNFVIGALVALVAVLIIYSTRKLTGYRFSAVYSLIAKERDEELPKGFSFMVFWTISLGYALAAAVPVVLIEAAANSSGIPEVKMILNGVKMPRITRFKTLLCRIWGNIFSVSSGLPAGYEGPMISIGAAVAAGVSQGKSTTLGFDTRWSVWNEFRNDKEKRDFIVCGAGAGVAAAFNAPVGGVLFSYEESASFWHKSLTWRAFFCAVIGAYVIDVFLSGMNNGSEWGQLSSPGMFNFGDFNLTGQTAHSWNIWELPLFFLLGVLGGIFGAMFVALNQRLTSFRLRYVNGKRVLRFLDVALMSTVVSVCAFIIPLTLGTCQPRPPTGPNALYAEELVSFYCNNEEYNDIASVWFTSTEEAIRQFYHFSTPFSLLHVGVFFVAYTTLMCVAAGTSVPAGLFIPTLLSGSALGRFVGELANILLPHSMHVDAGTYALIGSAAMLAGTTRMSISLAVILLECTGNYQYGLPIMVTLMSGRFIGNLFNHGLYDMQIELRKWPMLEDKVRKSVANALRVSDIMTTEVLVFQEVEKVGRILDVLKSVDYSGFPVIFNEAMLRTHPRLGNLAGYIQRKHLAVLLAHRAFHEGLPPGMASVLESLNAHSGGSPSHDANTNGGVATAIGTAGAVVALSDAPSTPATAAGMVRDTMPSIGGDSLFGSPSWGGVGSANLLSPAHSTPGVTDRTSMRFVSPRTLPTMSRLPSMAEGGTSSGAGLMALDDDTVSNRHALQAALTGRVSTTRNFRLSTSTSARRVSHSTINAEPSTAVASTVARSSFRQRRSVSAAILAETPISSSVDEEVVAEPAASAALYSASYDTEFRYPDEPLLLFDAFEKMYPRYPDVSGMTFTEAEREMYVDLRPYMDPTPVALHIHTPVSRAFKIFRDLGLRHLMVTNNCNDVVGVVSRQNLTMEHLHDCEREVKAVEAELMHSAPGSGAPGGSGSSSGSRSGAKKKKSKTEPADSQRLQSQQMMSEYMHRATASTGGAPSAADFVAGNVSGGMLMEERARSGSTATSAAMSVAAQLRQVSTDRSSPSAGGGPLSATYFAHSLRAASATDLTYAPPPAALPPTNGAAPSADVHVTMSASSAASTPSVVRGAAAGTPLPVSADVRYVDFEDEADVDEGFDLTPANARRNTGQ